MVVMQPDRAPVRWPAAAAARSDRFVAGVAGGVADHLGVPVLWVRAAFVVLAAINGAGSMRLRAAVGLRPAGGAPSRAPTSPRRSASRRSGLAALGVAAALAAAALGNDR